MKRNDKKNKRWSLSIILLAAGDSKRFEGNKMLAMIDGKPLYLHMADKVQKIPAFEKVIVTQYQEIIETINNDPKYSMLKAIKNGRSDLGISYSIELGIRQCSSDAYLFAVCDQPWLKEETILKLIQEFFKSKKGIACLSCQGRPGNPVIFDKKYREELLSLKGDVGGRSVMKSHMDDVLFVEVEDTLELLDIDTKEDYNYV